MLRNEVFLFQEKNSSNQKFFHIGPPRDFDLFKSFKKNKVLNIKDADYLLCTGLFDDHDKDLNYYINLLNNYTSKKLIEVDTPKELKKFNKNKKK